MEKEKSQRLEGRLPSDVIGTAQGQQPAQVSTAKAAADEGDDESPEAAIERMEGEGGAPAR